MDQQSATPQPRGSSRPARLFFALMVAALLTGVFYLYGNPRLVIMLTDQLWACF